MNRSRLHEAFSLQLKRKEKVEHHLHKLLQWPANTAVCPRSSPQGCFEAGVSIKIEVDSRFEKSP